MTEFPCASAKSVFANQAPSGAFLFSIVAKDHLNGLYKSLMSSSCAQSLAYDATNQLSIKAPKNQPTIILMAGIVLSTCAFLSAITQLLLEISHSDFGTKATVFTSVFVTLAPLLFVCFILQALFLRSNRKSIFDLKALSIVLFFIGQLG
jgi:hypothetical protein